MRSIKTGRSLFLMLHLNEMNELQTSNCSIWKQNFLLPLCGSRGYRYSWFWSTIIPVQQTISWMAQQRNDDSCIDFQQQPWNISTRLLHWSRKKEGSKIMLLVLLTVIVVLLFLSGVRTVIRICTWELNPNLNSNIFGRGIILLNIFCLRLPYVH